MYAIWVANNSGSLEGAFLEYPADPAYHAKGPDSWECSSIESTRCMKNWCLNIDATTRTFDQCSLGHPACLKSTTIVDKLGMTALDDKWCKCYGRSRKRGGITPEELGRYGRGLMFLLADKIANTTPAQRVGVTNTSA